MIDGVTIYHWLPFSPCRGLLSVVLRPQSILFCFQGELKNKTGLSLLLDVNHFPRNMSTQPVYTKELRTCYFFLFVSCISRSSFSLGSAKAIPLYTPGRRAFHRKCIFLRVGNLPRFPFHVGALVEFGVGGVFLDCAVSLLCGRAR